MTKTLYRSKKNKIVAGVCGGMGEYFDVDPIWFRIAALVLVLGYGAGILIYIAAWILIPEAPTATKKTVKKTTKKTAKKK